jgi:hypothetical protein
MERFLTLLNHSVSLTSFIRLDNSLIGNVLELAWSTKKFLPNPVGKLDRRDKVAYTEVKIHRDLEHTGVITA